jgi:RimJ/RimL family protein N-acetyltransferase
MPTDFDLDAVTTYINVTLAAQAAADTGIALAIVLKDTGEVPGSVGLYGVAERSDYAPAQGSVREWIAAPYRRDGHAIEALDLLGRRAFTELRLERITAYAMAGNTISRRLTERAGFQGRSVLRSAVMRDGRPDDIWYSDLLPTDLEPNESEDGM